jgi:two-component system NtrC family sensor kinase
MSTRDYISNVFPGLRGIPHFIVAAKGTSDGKKWLLRATVDFDKFSSLVEGIRIGQTGSAFIINREGEFQTKPNPVAVPLISRYIGRLTSSEAAVNSPRSVELSEISTEDILYVTSDLKKGEWVLIFQQTISDAYSALFTAKAITLTIFIIGSILIAATAILLSRRVVKRITSADQEKEMMNEKVVEAGKLASLGELAAGIAHEINNPVAVMVEEAGWLQDLLAEETGASIEAKEEFQRSLDQIRTQGARCKQITHKLLSFARKTDPIPKKVNINDVVREAVALCQQRIRSGNLKLVSVLGDDLPLIRVSPTEAQQVLINLINNAVDALEAQGGLVQITTRSEEDYVVVDVEDNGPGIPSYVLPRIFDPFFTTKQVGKGTGLGLSICYGIMKKLDGEITVNTSEGLGTQFHVKFPIPKAKRKSA